MARMNGKKHVGHSSSLSKQLLLVLASFGLGYLTASLFDSTSLSTWVNKQLLAQQTLKPTDKSIAQEAHLPPPKYEFYTLLTSDNHPVAKQPIQTAAAPASVPVVAAAKPTTQEVPVLALAQPIKPTQTETAKPMVKVVAAKPVKPSSNNRNAYYVQVAAFKSNQEAERMKASLVIKGFTVTISMIQQNKANWYRVSLGPYGSLGLAQNAQSAIARREHIVGMVRQLDA